MSSDLLCKLDAELLQDPRLPACVEWLRRTAMVKEICAKHCEPESRERFEEQGQVLSEWVRQIERLMAGANGPEE